MTPSVLDEDKLYEVVGGQQEEQPSMGRYANLIAGRLFGQLLFYLQANPLGQAAIEELFVLNRVTDLRRRPDVAFVSRERWPLDQPNPDGDWDVVPDLAVEVVSPRQYAEKLEAKRTEYFQAGVRQVWLVYPQLQRVHVYSNPTELFMIAPPQDLDGGALLPGFRLALTDLFRR